MTSKLVLHNRPENTLVTIQLPVLRAILKLDDEKASVALYRSLEQFKSEDGDVLVHDHLWLEQIAAWTPTKDGQRQQVKFKEQHKWLRLLTKLNALKDEDGETLVLSVQEEEAIWDRLNSDEFTVETHSAAWAAFCLDFAQQTGRHFGGIKEDKPAAAGDSAAA